MREVVITHGVRTPIGKFGQSLKEIDDISLGKQVLAELVHVRADLDPHEIDHVILGKVKQNASLANVARNVSLAAKLAEETPCFTVHRQCGSGLQAIMDGFEIIKAEEAEVIVAGGVENMSQSAYFIRNTQNGLGSSGNVRIEDSLIAGGPSSIPIKKFGNFPMGLTAENLADQYDISRDAQDQFAQESQERMAQAMASGYFDSQLLPVKNSAGDVVLAQDEHPFLSSIEKLGSLRPVFKKDGSVTAGNSSGRNDGAAAVLMMTQEKAEKLGYQPLAKVISIGASGCDPLIMGIGPVESTRIALKKADLTIDQLDVIELNEAFSAQSLAVIEEWSKWSQSKKKLREKINPNGGAIAHGHPLGCTGAALTVKCMYELQRIESHRYGLISLCCAGGLGVSVIIEKVKEG